MESRLNSDSKFMILNSAPRAYSEGTTNFYGYDFLVNQHTLIPRPETEQLVERTHLLAKEFLPSNPRILDVGTGSGVIAITLGKLLPNAQIEATDISSSALDTAQKNAEINQVQITFHHGSLFEPVRSKFDLIIANLPYVPAARWRFLEGRVRDFEPKSAIIAGRDGLKWIRLFCQQVNAYLYHHSIVALEIDDTHGPRVKHLLSTALPNHFITVEQDLAHKARFAFAVPDRTEV